MIARNRPGLRAIRIGCLTAMLAGIVWNARFAIADLFARRNQPDDTRMAMRLAPDDSVFAAQMADEVYAMDPSAAKGLLQRAVQLNRFDAGSWIQLGLLHEAGNAFPQAEAALVQAAAVDATFLPSWSLTNFYFRHADRDRFWYWAQRAAQMVPDDATSLFRLAWYERPNGEEIEQRLRIERPMVQGQFIQFLIAQGDAQAVAAAASHLLQQSSSWDVNRSGVHAGGVEYLLAACEWLIANHHAELALPLWNELSRRRQIPYSRVAPGAPNAITNGMFNWPPTSSGFDWHLPVVVGVSSFLNVHPNMLGFEFSGEQPERITVMDEVAPVEPGRDYALAVSYETRGILPGSGLHWAVTDVGSGAILAQTASLSREGGGEAFACFTDPAGSGFVTLSLLYQRQPGTVRVEGELGLKEVRLSPAAAADCRAKKIADSGAASPAF